MERREKRKGSEGGNRQTGSVCERDCESERNAIRRLVLLS